MEGPFDQCQTDDSPTEPVYPDGTEHDFQEPKA